MSHFAFLLPSWPELHEAASKAEALAFPDPRAACFYARRALEIAVAWLYRHDPALRLPYQDHLSALIHEPSFQDTVGQALFIKARLLKDLGNHAVHSQRPVRSEDAVTAARELFHFAFWLARSYARSQPPPDGLAFDPARLPRSSPTPPQTLAQLQDLASQLAQKDARLAEVILEKDALDQALQRLRAELQEAKARNAARPDEHDYSEAQTRDAFIDHLLREAGWPLTDARDREFPVTGMPSKTGKGFVDYVLWDDDGKPLAVIEAKRTRKDARIGQQQGKLYADCLERQFGQRPLIFFTNGYEHWLWDDLRYPPRLLQGFYKKAELQLIIQRRSSLLPLAQAEISAAIVDRYYQTRAIRRIAESFERDHQRKALLVMATGAGKTRTVVALCDLLLRCNWVKRVLFLADRVALVKQAQGAFKRHLPSSNPVNLIDDRDAEGRVYLSTYPTMMGLIDREVQGDAAREPGEAREPSPGGRRFGVGHFDLVIIDEAHRSVYQKYGAIFSYFDALLVGLTATPKDEVDRNTYGLFDLESGVPTDCYELETAVADGNLVPPRAVSAPLRFQRDGIRYADLSEDEKEAWDATEWSEDGQVPSQVESAAVNKWLFNQDTVDKVLAHLMTRGQRVAGDERLGKTILFAKNQNHANYIAERFDINYPHLRGSFARVITHGDRYAQHLIEEFSKPDRPPHLAISVDMLDTGIDVPQVVNLVFFKLVRSKSKFWQMLGRGTRLSPDLLGPGKHKAFFYIFDYCQNLEHFSQNPETSEGALGASLSKRLFTARLELIGALDAKEPAAAAPAEAAEARPVYGAGGAGTPEAQLREDTAELLRGQVAAMNLDNFIVRPKRRTVERFAGREAWRALREEDRRELAREVAGLPTALPEEDEEAKRFDLLLLRLQLAVLQAEPGFARLREQVVTIAGLLEEQRNIPAVREQLALILEIQEDEYWQDVTVAQLEVARKRLRALVRLIEKKKRQPVYTDFEDELESEALIELPGLGAGSDFERFRQKAQLFLRAHEDHLTIRKLRLNRPLTATDLDELGRMLVAAGVGTGADLERAQAESAGLGLFIRSLVGLDREAAKQAFGRFLADGTATANQIEFINLMINHLTQHGAMELRLLYESPFTELHQHGPEGLFSPAQLDELQAILDDVRRRAAS